MVKGRDTSLHDSTRPNDVQMGSWRATSSCERGLVSRSTHCAADLRAKRIADILIQARANKNSTGDLQKKLDAQKKQTREQTLKEIANENNRHRDAEATRAAQTHR